MPLVPTKKPIAVYGPRSRVPSDVTLVNTTSHGKGWERDLSPFFLGPVDVYGGYVSQTMENLWQYAKVYLEHYDSVNDAIKESYWDWAIEGWNNSRAVRYPMGKGAKPLFSVWRKGKHLERYSYVQARREIYIPKYAQLVVKTKGYQELKRLYQSDTKLGLWDFDGYDYLKLGMTLHDVVNCETRKMGHAFVLVMLLQGLIW